MERFRLYIWKIFLKSSKDIRPELFLSYIVSILWNANIFLRPRDINRFLRLIKEFELFILKLFILLALGVIFALTLISLLLNIPILLQFCF